MVPSNRLALKEWAVVVDALVNGQQSFLLRKGGIAEPGGAFRVEHSEFSLYPTFLHQDKQYIRSDFHHAFGQTVNQAEAIGRVRIASYAIVTETIPVANPAALHTLESHHVWTPAYIRQRYDYKPANPLWLLLLRVHRLPHPVTFDETHTYRGCKSWVTLDFAIETAGAAPVLPDREFEDRCRAIREALQS